MSPENVECVLQADMICYLKVTLTLDPFAFLLLLSAPVPLHPPRPPSSQALFVNLFKAWKPFAPLQSLLTTQPWTICLFGVAELRRLSETLRMRCACPKATLRRAKGEASTFLV